MTFDDFDDDKSEEIEKLNRRLAKLGKWGDRFMTAGIVCLVIALVIVVGGMIFAYGQGNS